MCFIKAVCCGLIRNRLKIHLQGHVSADLKKTKQEKKQQLVFYKNIRPY